MEEMNLEHVKELLRALDWNLTGCSINESKLTQNSQLENLEKMAKWCWEGEYYLSDGGYSRVWLDPYADKVFLTDNSSPKVKNNWSDEYTGPNVQGLVKELKEEFTEARRRAEANDE